MSAADASSPKVFAVIVTYNGEKWIAQCIESLINGNYDTKIIVVDNNSNDKTCAILKNYTLTLIKETKNHGFGVANNIGISHSLQNNADYIFLLNQDAFVKKNTILNLVNAAEKDKDYGLYSPIHLNEAGDDFDNGFLKNYVIDGAPQYLSDSCIKGETKRTYPIHSTNAAAWFVRRKTFEVVGGFDPLFFMYGEDNDFSNRLQFHEIKCAIVSNSFIHHSRGKNALNNPSFWVVVSGRAKRIRANTLAKIKNPSKKFPSNAFFCFVNLLFAAINELFYGLNFKEFLAHIIAILHLILEMKKIACHRKICVSHKGSWLINSNNSTFSSKSKDEET